MLHSFSGDGSRVYGGFERRRNPPMYLLGSVAIYCNYATEFRRHLTANQVNTAKTGD